MQIFFRSVKTDAQLAMPVTPAEFSVEFGRNITVLDKARPARRRFRGSLPCLTSSWSFCSRRKSGTTPRAITAATPTPW